MRIREFITTDLEGEDACAPTPDLHRVPSENQGEYAKFAMRVHFI